MQKKFLLVMLVALMICGYDSAFADEDNQILLSGGAVAVERINGSPAQWLVTLETSRGPIRVACTGSSVSDCSAMTSGSNPIPALLNTGGCLPLFEATSSSSQIWACEGSGTGSCRTMEGWLQGNNFVSFVTPTAATSTSCY